MKKEAVVIGATGLVGSALIDQLAIADHISRITVLSRRHLEHSSKKVAVHITNFDDLEKSASLIKGDCFFSCLGTTLKQAGSIAEQRKVDLDYQLRAAKIAAANGVQHYQLISSAGADAKSRSPYLKMKGELEESVGALPFKRISIIQPSLLLGARTDARFGEKIASWVLPTLCHLPMLKRYRPISAEAVAARMVQLSQQNGQAYEKFLLDEIFIDD